MNKSRYFYRVERITHRPTDEDKITVIKEVIEEDLHLARILATKYYLDEMQHLQGKYSPACFESYDTKKGIGFNYQVLLVDSEDDKSYLVESTMEKLEATVAEQKKEEERTFMDLGLDYSGLAF